VTRSVYAFVLMVVDSLCLDSLCLICVLVTGAGVLCAQDVEARVLCIAGLQIS
jgi:hypothetical protein